MPERFEKPHHREKDGMEAHPPLQPPPIPTTTKEPSPTRAEGEVGEGDRAEGCRKIFWGGATWTPGGAISLSHSFSFVGS